MTEIEPGLIYLTRAEWGARTDIPRLGHLVNRLDRTEAWIHHTVIVDQDATPNRWETITEVETKMVQLQTIRPDLGLDVPYNFVAFHMADGSLIVCEGRGLDRTATHTRGHNTRGIATAGQGNFQVGQPLGAYIAHWSRWWGWLKHDQGMENLGMARPTVGSNAGAIAFGHRDVIATSCPGDNLYAIIPQLTFKSEPIEEDDMSKHISSPKHTGMEVGGFKWEIANQEQHQAIHALGYVDTPITDAQWDALPNFPSQGGAGGVGGLTLEEAIAANQEAARRGTG